MICPFWGFFFLMVFFFGHMEKAFVLGKTSETAGVDRYDRAIHAIGRMYVLVFSCFFDA